MFTHGNGGDNDVSMNCSSLSNDANKLQCHSFPEKPLLFQSIRTVDAKLKRLFYSRYL